MKVMVIGDLHLPFDHPNYLKFLRDQYELEQPDKVVFIGDFIDMYALSRFSKDPEVMNQRFEWQEAMKRARKYYKLFPEATWIIGNHDRRPYRLAQDAGLGENYLKPLKEIYECPKAWDVVPSCEIEGVKYIHGELVGGQKGWVDLPYFTNQSVVCGHLHSVAGTSFIYTDAGDQLFIMETGSGIDDRAYAFAYGKNSKKRSVLSCGFVTDGIYPQVKPMDLGNRKYRRIR